MLIVEGVTFRSIQDALRSRFIYHGREVHVGEWQGQVATGSLAEDTIELQNVTVEYPIPGNALDQQIVIKPNMPWAEMHFLERVGGQPLNPPPSHEHWPFARKDNEAFTDDKAQFSHTYPERFWPKAANRDPCTQLPGCTIEEHQFNRGIRFPYGDLEDLVNLLIDRPHTRQAYLPVWFPEDLRAAELEERVPCTLGYHFLIRDGEVHVNYYMRSCDFMRHFADDAYMACRLALWVAQSVGAFNPHYQDKPLVPGTLYMHMASLHIFKPDMQLLRREHDH